MWRIYYDIADVEFELISSFWPSLPADIQAAYENPNDKLLVFKGNFAHHDFSSVSGYLSRSVGVWGQGTQNPCVRQMESASAVGPYRKEKLCGSRWL